MATIVEGNPKAPFSIATTPKCRGGRYSFPGLLYLTLDQYLIMLSVKQGGIKYHFLSLWYDSTWDWTQVSRAIGEHSVSLLTTRNMYVYKNIRLYFYFWRWYLCGAEKQSQRVRTHGGAVRRRKSQWTTDFSRN